jgi:AcrR family transcriptional regulator
MVKTRREEYAESTREALLDAAERAFVERGYAGASLDDVAAEARVTKGALYHHFANKQALFEAVFLRLDELIVARTAAAMSSSTSRDPLRQALAGIGGFLELCEDTRFRRVVLEEGPAALGWARWRELDEPYGLAPINAALRQLVAAGVLSVGSVDVLARMLFGALMEAAMAIAHEEPSRRKATRSAVERSLATMLEGFRR